ncbi:MAG TPA: hypothetical protein VF831_10810 [Anaerolineales bacterium]
MKSQTVLNFAIFICLLVVGYTVSSRFYHADDLLISVPVNLSMGNETKLTLSLNNGQRSILLAGVDSFDNPKPELNSLWMVSYLPSDATLRMLPIYPTGKVTSSDFEGRLLGSFGLAQVDSQLVLGKDFVRFLEESNYWWSSYIIYDQVAQEKMIDLLGGIEMNGEIIYGNQVIQKLSTLVEDPQTAYLTQLAGLQAACSNLSSLVKDADWVQLFSMTPAHISTNLDLQLSITEWLSSSPNQEGSNCTFPSLEIAQGNH